MNNKQYHKILISFIISTILLGVVVYLLVLVLQKPKDVQVNNYVGQSIKGDKGDSGSQGIQGISGTNSVSTNTIIEKQTTKIINQITNVPVKGDTGEKGDKGDISPRQLIRVDYTTCRLQTKYEDDDIWQNIAQLPKPCEVEDGD